MSKAYMQDSIDRKENVPEIPKTGMAALQQQFVLAQAIETWIAALKKDFEKQ